MVYETELCHYGVKGMKWGVRKQRSTTGSHSTDKKIKRKKPLTIGQKVAIGAAATAAVLATAYAGYSVARAYAYQIRPIMGWAREQGAYSGVERASREGGFSVREYKKERDQFLKYTLRNIARMPIGEVLWSYTYAHPQNLLRVFAKDYNKVEIFQ